MCREDLICEDNYLFDVSSNSIVAYIGMDSEVIIPETLGERKVRRIGKSAFKNLAGIKSVIIPEGVVEIGPYAFEGWVKLESITLPSRLTYFYFGLFGGLR